MHDDARVLFDASLETIPVPLLPSGPVVARGRKLSRRRAIVRTACAGLVLAASAVGATALMRGPSSAPPIDRPAREDPVDARAFDVLEDLGSICAGYDFYFKTDLGPAEYRPVECGMIQELVPAGPPPATPPPSPPSVDELSSRLVRGPRAVVYAFSSRAAKRLWLEAHEPFRGGRIAGEDWVVDVVPPSEFPSVRNELPGGRVVAHPRSSWTVGEHVVSDPPIDFRPVPLRRVSRAAIAHHRELLAAELASYRHGDSRGVPAWVLTFRRCVPQFGGVHASTECEGDRLHIVFDASSGERVATFTS
jgi:hypothetical protein